jgi:hypothetical protein
MEQRVTSPTNRRSFVSTLGALTGLAFLRPSAATAGVAPIGRTAPWDLAWIDGLKGKHRQVFDFGSRDLGENGNPLRVPRNYLNAFREVYGLEGADLNTIIGITSPAFPMNATDPIWEKYKLGERWKIKDPLTDQWSVRNIFLAESPATPGASIQALQARGTIFWQCNNALRGVTTDLAKATGGSQDDIRAELIAGFVPGVKLVPAHTMMLGLVQERAFTYEKV